MEFCIDNLRVNKVGAAAILCRETEGPDGKAQVTSLATRTIERYVQRGELQVAGVVDGQNVYRMLDVVNLARRAAAEAAINAPRVFETVDGEIDIDLERAKKLRAERIAQELKNAQSLGELAPLDMMQTSVSDALAMACSWLQSVPSRIKRAAPEIAGSTLDRIERELAALQNSICDCRITYTDPRMSHFSDDDAIDATAWRAEIETRSI